MSTFLTHFLSGTFIFHKKISKDLLHYNFLSWLLWRKVFLFCYYEVKNTHLVTYVTVFIVISA